MKSELLEEQPLSTDDSCDLPLGDLSLPLPEIFLEEALQLVGLDDDVSQVSYLRGHSGDFVRKITIRRPRLRDSRLSDLQSLSFGFQERPL